MLPPLNQIKVLRSQREPQVLSCMAQSGAMTCPSCGAANQPDVRVCHECGVRLERGCHACGAACAAEQRFCIRCGARLDAAAPAPASRSTAPGSMDRFAPPSGCTPAHLAERILEDGTALQGERKQVTLLFADVSGFTALAETLDSEEVHGTMNRAFELMLGDIRRYFASRRSDRPVAGRLLEEGLAIATARGMKPLAERCRQDLARLC